MNLYFIKACSRLGLLEIPWTSSDNNQGVEDAPEVLFEAFCQLKNQNFSSSAFQFTSPENTNKQEYFNCLVENFTGYQKVLNSLSTDKTNIFLGGDHSISFGSYLWLSQNFEASQVGILHIDTHPDIMLFQESKTLNFHGKWQRAFFGDLDEPTLNGMVKQKLDPNNLIIFGNFNDEQPNMDFLKTASIKHFYGNQTEEMLSQLSDLKSRVKHIHVSFDVDGLDQSVMPATGIPCQNGLLRQQVSSAFQVLRNFPSLSVDIVEYNPKKDPKNVGLKTVLDLVGGLVA